MSEELTAIRQQIDAIDRDLFALFVERMRLSDKIAEIKREGGIPLVDHQREETILQRTVESAPPDLQDEALAFMSALIDMSKSRQSRQIE